MSQLCFCGCGEETRPATTTNKKYGWVKGEPNKYLKGHNRPWLGKKRPSPSLETKTKQRMGHLNKKYNVSESGRLQMLKNLKIATTPENRAKGTAKLKGRKLSDAHMATFLKNRAPSSFEKIIISLINKHSLSYRWVGDGSFLVGGYSPDFISIDGKRRIVEVFYTYFKTNRGTVDISEWKARRKALFESYGWEVIFFDEKQIRDSALILQSMGSA